MGKENGGSENALTLTLIHGRPVTRALASTLRSLDQIKAKNQPRVSKRTALEQKKANAPKKRAVLRDITNISSDPSYQNCSNVVKVQKKVIKKEDPCFVTSELSDLQSENATAESKESNPCFDSSLVTNEKMNSRLPPRPPKVLDNPKFIDIDTDHKHPLLCSLYAPEIYQNLRAAELKRRAYPDFMKKIQKDITQTMRGILVDWLVEVSEEYTLVPDTLYLTVYLIDWFLNGNYIEKQKLQLLGITCMLIASKYEEICAPRIEEFCFITDNTYTRNQVLEMESEVLKYSGFQIYTPTSKTFLRRFLRAAQISHPNSSLELEFLANYLTELTLIDYEFLKFLPSVIAASAVFLAKWTMDQSCHPWNPTLEHYTTYKASDLKVSILALQELQLNTKLCPLNAIRMKYKQDKFKSVAALSSPKLLDELFLRA